ncbi:hypothetical protein NLI96_g10290 [Meripilus lineatus]|uniref:Uncharacterized protein n=1 Tax=Meripilus lineatus TaxID=2056292 RepID=A0AAD5Y9F4_9APHY|nr:hypothetical protein NLI96_g10290 [Physisporinus lineatus]
MHQLLENIWGIAAAVDATPTRAVTTVTTAMMTTGIRTANVVIGTLTQGATTETIGIVMAMEETTATGGTAGAHLPLEVAVDVTLPITEDDEATLEALLVAAAHRVTKGGNLMRPLAPLLRQMEVNRAGEE